MRIQLTRQTTSLTCGESACLYNAGRTDAPSFHVGSIESKALRMNQTPAVPTGPSGWRKPTSSSAKDQRREETACSPPHGKTIYWYGTQSASSVVAVPSFKAFCAAPERGHAGPSRRRLFTDQEHSYHQSFCTCILVLQLCIGGMLPKPTASIRTRPQFPV